MFKFKFRADVAVALALGAACASAAPASATTTTGLNAVQYFYTTSFAAGSQSDINATITPVTPAGQVLVIQSVSVYRYPANPSTLQTFVAITYGGHTGYFSLPDIGGSNSTSDFYPTGTANFTGYVTAGTHAYVNLYRTGGSSYPAETDYITVSGYLTPGS
jgi:hypothetical protein